MLSVLVEQAPQAGAASVLLQVEVVILVGAVLLGTQVHALFALLGHGQSIELVKTRWY